MTTSAEDFAIEGEQEDPTEPQPEELPTGEPPPHKPVQHAAWCKAEGCKVSVVYQPSASGAGFMIREYAGVEEPSFGIGEHGIPTCPRGHGEMELADEQLPAEEAFALAQEQIAQQAPRLPFPTPPFNYEGAIHSIFDTRREVARLEIKLAEADERRKKAKAALDAANEELGELIDKFEEAEKERLAELERKQAAIEAGHPEGTNLVRCKWEEAHPGQVCPICRDDDLKPDAARDSEAHVEEVAALVDVRSAVAVSDALEAFGVLVPVLTIQRWTQDERAAVKAWAEFDRSSTDAAPERPKVLGTCHVAGPGVDGEPQCCTQCDAILITARMDGDDPSNFYAEGILVGTDCAGRAKTDGHRYPKRGRRKKAETTEATE